MSTPREVRASRAEVRITWEVAAERLWWCLGMVKVVKEDEDEAFEWAAIAGGVEEWMGGASEEEGLVVQIGGIKTRV